MDSLRGAASKGGKNVNILWLVGHLIISFLQRNGISDVRALSGLHRSAIHDVVSG